MNESRKTWREEVDDLSGPAMLVLFLCAVTFSSAWWWLSLGAFGVLSYFNMRTAEQLRWDRERRAEERDVERAVSSNKDTAEALRYFENGGR